MAARIFLTIIGLIYVALGIWCSVDPQTTSAKLGLNLENGSARSEFLTVFGGLEVGLGLVLLMPLVKPDSTGFALTACLLVHLCLALFRTAGYMTIEGIQRSTLNFAIAEWVILVASLVLTFLHFRNSSGGQ